MPQILNNPLTESQLYMLELMGKFDNSDLLEFKKMVRKYLATKLTKEVDKVWVKNNLSEKEILSSHLRIPYN
jgi:hypothetical protein